MLGWLRAPWSRRAVVRPRKPIPATPAAGTPVGKPGPLIVTGPGVSRRVQPPPRGVPVYANPASPGAPPARRRGR